MIPKSFAISNRSWMAFVINSVFSTADLIDKSRKKKNHRENHHKKKELTCRDLPKL